ncbi:MAG: SET domain-containing protein [bacterium]|nr:SET domain-containing protein [bacterium]
MQQKEKILNCLKNIYCRLKPSKIEGIGVFAIKDIPKNIDPFRGVKKQKWQKFTMSELKKLDKETLKMIDDFFVIRKKGIVYISESGLNSMDISYFLNNSEKPNLKTINDGVSFITLRKVKKGEELVFSYAVYD